MITAMSTAAAAIGRRLAEEEEEKVSAFYFFQPFSLISQAVSKFSHFFIAIKLRTEGMADDGQTDGSII